MKNYGRIILYIVLILIAIVNVFPFYWMINVSLQPLEAVYADPPEFIAKHPTLDNYKEIFTKYNFLRFTMNSLFISLTAAIGQLFTCSLAGFAFARMKFPGKELLFGLIIATIMVPIEVVIIPEFLLMAKLGWINTYLPMIVPSFLIGTTGVFLMRSFYENVPKELEEAAVVDGAKPFAIYWRIFLPVSKASLSALFIISFLINWNAFLRPLIYLNSKHLYTLTLGLISFVGEFSALWNFLLAGAVVSVVPIFTVYLIMQKQFIEGITSTGVKG